MQPVSSEQQPTPKLRPQAVVLWLAFAIWIALYFYNTAFNVRNHLEYYDFARTATSEQIRAHHIAVATSSNAFYSILMQCDRLLPVEAKLQIMLPGENRRRNEYLRDKARYILYPRNNGNNEIRRPFILAYDVHDFRVPNGYRLLKTFGPDRALYREVGWRSPGESR